ncbi:MAG: phosphomannomutase/phosphoglucomutase [Actinomycetota bacterium]
MFDTSIVKAYDIRGIVPQTLNAEVIEAIGQALSLLLTSENETEIIVGHDMRTSAQDLVPRFIDTLLLHGIDVIDVGLVSTDALYFASGSLDRPGVMFTASHNPANYNGMKLCRRKAIPIGQNSGLDVIKEYLEKPYVLESTNVRGTLRQMSILESYADFFKEKFSISPVKPLVVAVDAANAMAGLTFPIVASRFNIQTHELYFELDGTFPNHPPNPIDPENLVNLQAQVRAVNADIGLAFDGDADRCFIVDEQANPVSPSVITALISAEILSKHPGAAIVYNVISSRIVPETIQTNGGEAIKSRVGHSFIKALMAKHDAEFGGEHSGHYYFKDFWFADSGMFAALYVLDLMSRTGKPLSSLISPYLSWHESGEINQEVPHPEGVMGYLKSVALKDENLKIDETDGLTIECDQWRVNIRMSNTEPLLRLNVLARSHTEVTELVKKYQALINEAQLQL